jgi:hypothetical protein
MRRAKYEILPDDGSFYGEIPGCAGVWATGATLEACRGNVLVILSRERERAVLRQAGVSREEWENLLN